ncbi:pentapeptide repeat protein [Pseudomonas sp. StFLB209]|uniref:pentapeptide repeat-containing protein n=1 Tax=Pseudomonas sp. StFLB209 TaxID=1028989 RepID=UPI0004F8899A|nr:pentapeptide repeat-containing protein [Pseudomonas sp. StFLB209]BAP44731.1 pentapeptide repeat protein [Pseudomonas sp. StFLB209]
MSSLTTGITATNKKAISSSLPKIDAKSFGAAVAKGVAHFFLGKFEDIADDAADAAASLGLKDNSPEVLAYFLLQKSITSAIYQLLTDSQVINLEETKLNAFQKLIEDNIQEIEVNADFLKNPLNSKFSTVFIDPLTMWLERLGYTVAASKTISQRLPGYIPYALHSEWSSDPQKYELLLKSIDSPFAEAANNESSWILYKSKLQAKLEESIFGEPFGLRQIYIPLNAVYEEKTCKKTSLEADSKKHVVSLIDELDDWVSEENSKLTIRTISGGPGSGKSSFSKIYAAHVFENKSIKTIFIPLHFIDPTRDFSEEVGRFVKDEGLLKYNPIAKEHLSENLLVILDGLDELASQGQAAAVTAKNFVRSVQQTVDRLNLQKSLIKVLFSGREVVIQNNESEFRLPGQVLTILPYHEPSKIKSHYNDPKNLLEVDLSELWWKNYGDLIGKPFTGLPKDLQRDDLREITAQPLLNYLLALSYCRGRLNFNTGVNLNEIYSDLVEAIYERGYEKGRRHESIRSIDLQNFLLILEEIGLAAWHGDGRTTTISEIEHYCREGGFSDQLDAFQDGAKAGITSLLAAFFFRQHGSRPKGDPTFVFTHKSFGEYLAARRITRAISDIIEERGRRDAIGRRKGRGWSDQECLKHWAEICGPTALSPNILRFLRYEIVLMDSNDCEEAQSCLTNLFNVVLRNAMPMEKVTTLPSFEAAMFQARNAEEALLASLNACARRNNKISLIEHPNQTAFGTWLKRIQEQRNGPQSALVLDCLSWLNLDSTCFDFADLWGANISHSTFRSAHGYKVMLSSAKANNTDFSESSFEGGFFSHTYFTDSNFEDAKLWGANFTSCDFGKSNFIRAKLGNADFKDARTDKCDFTDAESTRKGIAKSKRVKPKTS